MKNKFHSFAALSILVAVTAVLQTLSAMFPLKIAGLSISLVMIPITVAAVFYGYEGGALIGGTFGATVLIHCIMGLDPAGAMLFSLKPFYTAVLTVLRGVLAGALTALVYNLVKKIKNAFVKYLITGLSAAVFNTGIFLSGYALFFNDMLVAAANESGYADNVIGFVIVGMVGVNFLFEALTTALLAPPVCKALEKVQNK